MSATLLNQNSQNIKIPKSICSGIVNLLQHHHLISCPTGIEIEAICKLTFTIETIIKTESYTERNTLTESLIRDVENRQFFKTAIRLQCIAALSGFVDSSLLNHVLEPTLSAMTDSEIINCVNTMAWKDCSITKRLLQTLLELRCNTFNNQPVKEQVTRQLKLLFEGGQRSQPDKGIIFVSSNLLNTFVACGFECETDDVKQYWHRFRAKVIAGSDTPVVEGQLPDSLNLDARDIALFISIIAVQVRKRNLDNNENKIIPEPFINLLAQNLQYPFQALLSGAVNERIFLHHSYLPSFTPYFQIARRTEMLEADVPLNTRDRSLASALNSVLPTGKAPKTLMLFPHIMPFPNLLPDEQKNVEVHGYRHHFIDRPCYKINYPFTHWLPNYLPLLHGHYECITCICSFIFVPNRERLLNHLRNHLIEGGTFFYRFRKEAFRKYTDFCHSETIDGCIKLFESIGFLYHSSTDINPDTSSKLLRFRKN